MSEKMIITEPVFIEDHGQRIAVILPIETYEELRARAETIQTQAATPEPSSGFEQEKAAFERLQPELIKKYLGKCVAIVSGQVAEVGDDKIKVIDHVYERFGRVPMYVQWVRHQPRVYRFPYRKVSTP